MTTLQTLSDRLRSELNDVGKSFVETFTADGVTTRFQLSTYPVNGAGLVVNAGTTDVSDSVTIEEANGMLILDVAPDEGDLVTVAGTYYRYFTDAEICNYIATAFNQHTGTNKTAYGSTLTYSNLPQVEEYPVVLLASSMALFTLATDAAYDINIFSPDGVTIPRSERYSQLIDIMNNRKEQYRELCNLLGVGLYRIEVATLRRISNRTNRYVPVYIPQELDDSSRPRRLHVPIPTYMDQTKSRTMTYDIEIYRGDSFEVSIDFPFSLAGYELLSQIRTYAGSPVLVSTFTIVVTDEANGKATLSLTSDQTKDLPNRAVWDIQVTSTTDPDYQHTYLKGAVIAEDQVSNRNNEPYAPGWMG